MIDSSTHAKFNLKEKFDVSEEEKELRGFKNIRRNDRTPITHMSDDILKSGFKIDELNTKREKFSNDVSNIKIYKYK